MRRYTFFNVICTLLIFGAVFGTAYFARGYVKQWVEAKQNADIPIAVSRIEIEKRVQTSTAQVQVSSTSLKTITVTSSKSVSSSSISASAVAPTSSIPTPTPTSEDIPDSINLDVPFIPQAPEKNWDQPWQDACEEAAILMMDAYQHDKTISIDQAKHDILAMVKWEEDLGWGRSIEMEKMQKVFTDYLMGYVSSKLHVVENPSIDQIKKYVAGGQPVLVLADGQILPNPHFQNGGPPYHALIVRGYTKDSFITNDPGTQFGQNYKYKYSDLMNAIHDWNDGNVPSGRRVVLVIE